MHVPMLVPMEMLKASVGFRMTHIPYTGAGPAVIQTINRAGSPLEYLDAPEFQAYWDTDARLMIEAVRKIGKLE